MSLKSVMKDYEAALNAGDIDAILGLYGSEPVFMPQNAPALVGRDAVRAGYEQVFGAVGFDVTLTVHDAEEVGDWAWVRTSSTGTMKLLASGADIPEGNNELFVLRREGGNWKIHRYLFATALPA